jgi:hypothetical protein
MTHNKRNVYITTDTKETKVQEANQVYLPGRGVTSRAYLVCFVLVCDCFGCLLDEVSTFEHPSESWVVELG